MLQMFKYSTFVPLY